MEEWLTVTGANRGIGKALALPWVMARLAQADLR